MKTEVLVSFATPATDPEIIEVKIDLDLSQLLGSVERYYELAAEAPQRQREEIRHLLPQVTDTLQLFAGSNRLPLEFRSFSASTARKSDFLDASMSKLSTFRFVGRLRRDAGALKLVVPVGAPIDYPIAWTVQIPASHLSLTRWLEAGVHESDPFNWEDKLAGPAARFDPDTLSWPRQLALYLRLGFRHIVPEGIDHILFVLGLFFLGITWRKLLAQTTVFTIAHATTLFLSTYGIFSLPSRYVEPAIALSIAWIAIENVLSPRLSGGRLAVVFGFGLVHGLGFASSLSDIPFPKRDFLIALLGFNFGVDAGQLFVIALAFLAVGWFRNRPWFRPRIAIPASLTIAAIGLAWAVQRVYYYYGAAR